jgi:hypothetical protein
MNRLPLRVPCLALSLALNPALNPAPPARGHAEDAPPPPAAAAPRFAATSADLELVGSLEGARLVLFLDRYASNEPVAGARLDVESGDWKARAEPRPDGAYTLPAGPLAGPGRHPLVVTVEAGELADLLQATLTVPPPPPPDPAARDEALRHALHYATGAAAGLLLAGLGVWLTKRRRGA